MISNSKTFYDEHRNFSLRTKLEYYISPGIRCKYDILLKKVREINTFSNCVDLGCSGNSFLLYFNGFQHKSFLDLADLPLKQYLRLNRELKRSEKQRDKGQLFHPINGDICHLPYRDDSFDMITALDVLEHLESDEQAVSEMNRILKKAGYLIVTVPYQMKYFDEQDKMIGHHRRYELSTLNKLFLTRNFKIVDIFGVYGQLFKFSKVQQYKPHKIEEGIAGLRNIYRSSLIFRVFWDIFVALFSFFMRIDARVQPLNKTLNIGVILQKEV